MNRFIKWNRVFFVLLGLLLGLLLNQPRCEAMMMREDYLMAPSTYQYPRSRISLPIGYRSSKTFIQPSYDAKLVAEFGELPVRHLDAMISAIQRYDALVLFNGVSKCALFLINEFAKLQFQPARSYAIVKALGEGSFGTSYQARDSNGMSVTLKVIKDNSWHSFLSELRIHLHLLKAGNTQRSATYLNLLRSLIIPYKGMIIDENGLRILTSLPVFVFGYMDSDLAGFMRKNLQLGQRLCTQFCLNVIEKLLKGLAILQTISVVHDDIKPSNVLINFRSVDDFDLKITDFGMSKIISNREGYLIGSPGTCTYSYRSPEIYLQGPYTCNSDVFSAGLFFLDMWGAHDHRARLLVGLVLNDHESHFMSKMIYIFGYQGWLKLLRNWSNPSLYQLHSRFYSVQRHIMSPFDSHRSETPLILQLITKAKLPQIQTTVFYAMTQPDPAVRPSALEALALVQRMRSEFVPAHTSTDVAKEDPFASNHGGVVSYRFRQSIGDFFYSAIGLVDGMRQMVTLRMSVCFSVSILTFWILMTSYYTYAIGTLCVLVLVSGLKLYFRPWLLQSHERFLQMVRTKHQSNEGDADSILLPGPWFSRIYFLYQLIVFRNEGLFASISLSVCCLLLSVCYCYRKVAYFLLVLSMTIWLVVRKIIGVLIYNYKLYSCHRSGIEIMGNLN